MRTHVFALLLTAGFVAAVPALAEPDPEAAAEETADDGEDAAGPVTYTLQPQADGSTLYVKVYNDPTGLASRFGHDHAIAPTTYTGTVVWDAADPSACDIRIEFPASALTVDPGTLRDQAKLDPEGAVGDSAKETIKGNFLGKSQLHAREFATIRYASSSCAADGDRVKVTGTLTIRGVGKQVTVPMAIQADGETFSASGSFQLQHTDFGFKPFTNLAGALRNKPELDFVVDVSGQAG